MCEAELGTKVTGEREDQPVPMELPFYDYPANRKERVDSGHQHGEKQGNNLEGQREEERADRLEREEVKESCSRGRSVEVWMRTHTLNCSRYSR